MSVISAYKPTSYAPTNVTNGTSGATTPESQRNAALQSVSSFGGNPYAEAISHTMNWMQYQMPQQMNQAAMQSQMGAAKTTSVPGAAPVGTGATLGGQAGATTVQSGGMTGAFMPQTSGDPMFQTNSGTVPVNPAAAREDPLNPIGGGTDPLPGTGGGTGTGAGTGGGTGTGGGAGGGTGGGTGGGGGTTTPTGNTPFDPTKYGGINDYATKFPAGETWAQYQERTKLNGRAWSQDDFQRAALEYANTPGYGWMAYGNNWQMVQAYHAEVTSGGPAKGMHIAEWMVKNWDGIGAKLGVKPEDMQKMYAEMAPAAYDAMSKRLRDEYAKGGGKEDTSWVTPALAQKYAEWDRQRNKDGKPSLDFWTWAGSVNVGKPPAGFEPTAPTPPTGQTPPTAPTPGGAGTPPAPTPPPMSPPPTAPVGPDSQYLENLIKSLREQGAVGRDEALRQFRHEAGMSGLNDTGAYNPALGNLIQGQIRDENSAIYDIMNASSEADANRALQQYLGQLGYAGTVDSANIGANASNYSDQIRYLLGMTGFDVDREQNWWQNQLGYQDLMLRYLATLFGVSPDQILGGWTPPTGDAVVNNP